MRVLLIVLLAFGLQANAQDLSRYKRVVKELASKKYQGRGYAKGGANKAGKFLAKEYKRAGVDEVTLQPFTLDIQTFAGNMEMEADGKPLQTGVDFSMREYSPGVKGEFPGYDEVPQIGEGSLPRSREESQRNRKVILAPRFV